MLPLQPLQIISSLSSDFPYSPVYRTSPFMYQLLFLLIMSTYIVAQFFLICYIILLYFVFFLIIYFRSCLHTAIFLSVLTLFQTISSQHLYLIPFPKLFYTLPSFSFLLRLLTLLPMLQIFHT